MASSQLLLLLCLSISPATDPALSADLSSEEQALKAANLSATGPKLLEFFHKRTPSIENDAAVAPLIKQLSDKDPAIHQKAAGDLVALGPTALKALQVVANNIQDLEASARAKLCMQQIEGPNGAALVCSVIRVAAALKPEGMAGALIQYYPFADDESVTHELNQALAETAHRAGKPEPELLKALTDENVSRRAAAAVALCQGCGISVHERVRPLLKDPKPAVRFQIAKALATAHDAEAVPILIDLLAELPPAARKLDEEFLTDLAGDWAVKVPQGADATSNKLRRDLWQAWWKSLDAKLLLEEFKSRTLSDEDRATVLALIQKLDGASPTDREKASQELVAFGPKAVSLLRRATQQSGQRGATFAEKCIALIEKGSPNPLPPPAARLLALRRPPGTLETLLAYVPFAEKDEAAQELTELIGAVGVREGKADPLLVQALEDKVAVRRSTAALALCRMEATDTLPAVRKLLQDQEPEVRLRTAQALASIREREAVPVLIALLPELSLPQAYEVEDYLARLAASKPPETTPMTADPMTRKKARDTWAAWWKENGAKIDLATADAVQRTLGLTLLVENRDFTNPAGTGRVAELDAAGKVRWKIDGLNWPTHAQALPGQRVLIAEQNAARVTERDSGGKILWEKGGLQQPFVVQRLRNGNTFIACRQRLVEVDKTGKEVTARPVQYLLGCKRFEDGQIAYVTNVGQYVHLDATGKEVKTFHVQFDPQWGCNGVEILPQDHVIVSAQGANKLTEYSSDGKTVWEATVQHTGMPYRLANGQFLVPNATSQQLTVLDKHGKVVSEKKNLPVHPNYVSQR